MNIHVAPLFTRGFGWCKLPIDDLYEFVKSLIVLNDLGLVLPAIVAICLLRMKIMRVYIILSYSHSYFSLMILVVNMVLLSKYGASYS